MSNRSDDATITPPKQPLNGTIITRFLEGGSTLRQSFKNGLPDGPEVWYPPPEQRHQYLSLFMPGILWTPVPRIDDKPELGSKVAKKKICKLNRIK